MEFALTGRSLVIRAAWKGERSFTRASPELCFPPTFADGAGEAPGLVRPAGDGAAAFGLMAAGTGDPDRLSHMEVHLGARPVACRHPPAWGRRAALGCREGETRELVSFSKVRLCFCGGVPSHVGSWATRRSRRFPRCTPPEAPRPGRSLCRTGPPQRARCSGCAPAPCRAALVWEHRSLRPAALWIATET